MKKKNGVTELKIQILFQYDQYVVDVTTIQNRKCERRKKLKKNNNTIQRLCINWTVEFNHSITDRLFSSTYIQHTMIAKKNHLLWFYDYWILSISNGINLNNEVLRKPTIKTDFAFNLKSIVCLIQYGTICKRIWSTCKYKKKLGFFNNIFCYFSYTFFA